MKYQIKCCGDKKKPSTYFFLDFSNHLHSFSQQHLECLSFSLAMSRAQFDPLPYERNMLRHACSLSDGGKSLWVLKGKAAHL